MTYLVRVGFIPGNLSRTGACGYRVRRVGKVVHVWFGGIAVERRGGRTSYYWAAGWPRHQARRKTSIKEAIRYRQWVVAKKCGPRKRYEKLPSGTKISSR